MKELDVARLRELVICDPVAGTMVWKERTEPAMQAASWNQRNAGKPAGWLTNTGYRMIAVDNGKYLVHRLMWLFVHGEMPWDFIDHINGVRDDNRIENLRVAPQIINSKNQRLRSTNTSGVMGVKWLTRGKRWQAQICVAGRGINLGRYREKEDAIAARKAAERLHGFHPNHGRAA